MKLPFLRKSKSFQTGFIALDFNDKSVKALYLEVNPDKTLTAKGVSTKVTHNKNDIIAQEDVKIVIEDALIQSGGTTNEVIVGLSGSSVFGFVLIAKSTREKPENKITDTEISEIYDKIRNSAYTQAKQRWTSFFADDVDFEPLDLVVASVQIDAKTVSEPIGETGTTIQVGVFCSYAEQNHYKRVMSILKKLKLSALMVTTTEYSQSRLLTDFDKNFLLVDIGQDFTDVAVVFGKTIIQTKSFEFGGSYFTQNLIHNMNIDEASAKGKKEAFALETLPEDEMDKVGDYLYSAGKHWRSAFSAILTSMSGIKSFPKKIYLTGGGANLPIIQELLFEEEWRQSIPFASSLEIETVSSDKLQNRIKDELSLLKGPQMFVPASLGIIKLELDNSE